MSEFSTGFYAIVPASSIFDGDRRQQPPLSPLASQIEALEDRARRLESGWAEMLAMMRLEQNRENIRKGDPEIIDELFRLVDHFKARFDRVVAAGILAGDDKGVHGE